MWWIVFTVLVVMALLCLLRSEWERRHFKIVYSEITSDKVPESFDGYKFCFLADLHNNSFGEENEKLLKAIDKEKPDGILIAGDMLVSKGVRSTEVPEKLMETLCKKYPVYYSYGNHESRLLWEQETYGDQLQMYSEKLKSFGVKFLVDETVTLTRQGDRISISGLEIPKKYYKPVGKEPMAPDFLTSALGEADKSLFHIMLAHQPLYFKEYSDWGADLTCAGHFHGGTVRLPFFGGIMTPNYMFFPEYYAGEYHYKDSTMLLSSGLGTHSINVRFMNRPELYVITLKRRGK